MYITYQTMKLIAGQNGRFPCPSMIEKEDTIFCNHDNKPCEMLGKELPNE